MIVVRCSAVVGKQLIVGKRRCSFICSNHRRLSTAAPLVSCLSTMLLSKESRRLSATLTTDLSTFKIPFGYHVEPLHAKDTYKDFDIYIALEKFMRQFVQNVKPAEFGKHLTEKDFLFMKKFVFASAFQDNVSTLIWFNDPTKTNDKSTMSSSPDRELVAMCLSSIRHHDTYERKYTELLASNTVPEICRNFFRLIEQAHNPINPHLLFGQSKILVLEALSVSPEHCRKGLGIRAVVESIRRAWQFQGVNSVLGDAVNDLSARLNTKLGMQDICRFEYKNYVSESGDFIYKHVDGALRHMGRVIKSDVINDPLTKFLIEYI